MDLWQNLEHIAIASFSACTAIERHSMRLVCMQCISERCAHGADQMSLATTLMLSSDIPAGQLCIWAHRVRTKLHLEPSE